MIMNTILVVEDDIDIRELERYTLASNGYAVLQAEHGKQALEVLSSQSVDLIILDIMMPVMDGLTLIKTLRYGLNNTTPIIVVSAKGEESDIITALVDMGYDRRRVEELIDEQLAQNKETIASLGHHEAEQLLFRQAIKYLA